MKRKSLHIVLLTTIRLHRSKGGAEKVMIDMANEFVLRGHKVTIVCNDRQGSTPGFALSKNVQIINCASVRIPVWHRGIFCTLKSFSFDSEARDYKRAILNLNACACRFRDALSYLNPDVYITFDPKLSAMLRMNLKVDKPIITSMQFNPGHIIRRYYFKAVKTWLALSGVIHVLTPEYADKVKACIPEARVRVIPNVVNIPKKRVDLREKLIINVARVIPLKNQELIAKAFVALSSKYPDWKVRICGENNLDDGYVNRIKDILKGANVAHRFEFAGSVDNVTENLQEASIFAFPSINEGLPLALMEAMAAGLPCIALKECAGSRQLIKNGVNGLLCDNNPESFACSIELLINNVDIKEKIGRQARLDMQAYRADLIWDKWEDLLYNY